MTWKEDQEGIMPHAAELLHEEVAVRIIRGERWPWLCLKNCVWALRFWAVWGDWHIWKRGPRLCHASGEPPKTTTISAYAVVVVPYYCIHHKWYAFRPLKDSWRGSLDMCCGNPIKMLISWSKVPWEDDACIHLSHREWTNPSFNSYKRKCCEIDYNPDKWSDLAMPCKRGQKSWSRSLNCLSWNLAAWSLKLQHIRLVKQVQSPRLILIEKLGGCGYAQE